MLNQDIHKSLRRNKAGIPLENVEKLSLTYIRPPGFSLVPTLLGSSGDNNSQAKSVNGQSYYQYIKNEMQRYAC